MQHEIPAVETTVEASSDSALTALESKLIIAALARNNGEQEMPAA